jgi:hypothetical protein
VQRPPPALLRLSPSLAAALRRCTTHPRSAARREVVGGAWRRIKK